MVQDARKVTIAIKFVDNNVPTMVEDKQSIVKKTCHIALYVRSGPTTTRVWQTRIRIIIIVRSS